MRVVAVHEDVLVATSSIWQTNALLVRGGGEAFLIDSVVLPAELETLPAIADQAGFAVQGLLCTHADWDHVLGRLAFPEAPLGAGESTVLRLAAEPGDAQRSVREFDERYYLERTRPLSLPASQALPVPGVLEVGAQEARLHPASGHTSDGTAYELPWCGVLACGDYLSPVEIPRIEPTGSLAEYEATLARLVPLVEAVEAVVPGHGPVMSREQALRQLEDDQAYLERLRSQGAGAALPEGRRTGEQRSVHAMNAEHAARG